MCNRDAAALDNSLAPVATHTDIDTSPPIPTSTHRPRHIITSTHRVTTLQGVEAYTMQAKRGAGSRHTSRNIGGRVTHHAKEKKPPQATEGGQCAIGMQHHHPDTPSNRPARCGSLHDAGEAGCSTTHQAAALTGSSATHTHIDTPPHRVTTEGGHWHRRAICLQGVEALERGRDAAALTLVTLATLIHPDTATSPGTSSHRVITEGGQCAENQNIYISLQTIKINYFLMLYGRKNNIIPQSISRDFKETK